MDAENIESLHVALAVGAEPAERWENDKGRTMIRHLATLRPDPSEAPAEERPSSPRNRLTLPHARGL